MTVLLQRKSVVNKRNRNRAGIAERRAGAAPQPAPSYRITNGADTSTAYGVVPFLSSCST